MAQSTKLWQSIETENYFPELKVSASDLKKYEDQRGILLPSLYKSHLIEKNGGRPVLNSLPTDVPTTWAYDYANVYLIFGLRDEEGILDTDYLVKEWEFPAKKIVIFAMSEDTAFYYFDYSSKNENPSVKIFEPEGNLKGHLVADNYEEFIANLYQEDSYDFSDKTGAANLEEQQKWSDTKIFDKYIEEDNLEELLHGIIFYSTSDDYDWLTEKIIDLSKSNHSDIRVRAAELLLDIVEYSSEEVDSKLLMKAIVIYDRDNDPDVKSYMEDIKENMQ